MTGLLTLMIPSENLGERMAGLGGVLVAVVQYKNALHERLPSVSRLTTGEWYNFVAFLMLFVVVLWTTAEYAARQDYDTDCLSICLVKEFVSPIQKFVIWLTTGHLDLICLIIIWVVPVSSFGCYYCHKQQVNEYEQDMVMQS